MSEGVPCCSTPGRSAPCAIVQMASPQKGESRGVGTPRLPYVGDRVGGLGVRPPALALKRIAPRNMAVKDVLRQSAPFLQNPGPFAADPRGTSDRPRARRSVHGNVPIDAPAPAPRARDRPTG